MDMNTVTFHLELCLAPVPRSRCGCECGCWSKRADAGAAVGLSSYVHRARNFACARFFSPQNDGSLRKYSISTAFIGPKPANAPYRPHPHPAYTGMISPGPTGMISPGPTGMISPVPAGMISPEFMKQEKKPSLVKISQDFRPDLCFRSLT